MFRYVGGYGKLQKINFIDGLMNFTGGIMEQIEIRHHVTPLTYQDQKSFFKMIKSVKEDTFVLCNTASNKVIVIC